MGNLTLPRKAWWTLAGMAAALLLLLMAAGSAGRAFADDPQRSGDGIGPLVAGGKPVLGSRPFINILCKFKDVTEEPHDAAYYEKLIGINPINGSTINSPYPSVDNYWREVSYNALNLDGSAVVGWVKMAGNEADYRELDENKNPVPSFRYPDLHFSQDWEKLRTDCIAAADAAKVDFNPFKGINMFFNGPLDGASGGRAQTLALPDFGGHTRTLPIGFYTPDGAEPATVIHEMGHGFGLPHSSGPYDRTYDSHWDVMSNGWDCYSRDDRAKRPEDYPLGCVGVHTIAAHKAYLGWIPAARRFDVKPGPATTITLSRLAKPVTDGGNVAKWMAKLPIRGDARRYYTVELRSAAGYDSRLLANGVIIHKVDETREDRNAQLVDVDSDTSLFGGDVEWEAGETFTDTASGITIKVESISSTALTAQVTLTQAPLISINDVTVHEPAPAPPPAPFDPEPEPVLSPSITLARFTVRLAAPAVVPVTVNYATAPGTAKAGSDYIHKSGSVTIPAGSTTAMISVSINLDNLGELPETFFVNLSNPVNGKLIDAQGKGTIHDFD